MLDSDIIQSGSDSDDFVPRCKANAESKSAPEKMVRCSTTGESVIHGFCGYHSKFRKPNRAAKKKARLAIENQLPLKAISQKSRKNPDKVKSSSHQIDSS